MSLHIFIPSWPVALTVTLLLLQAQDTSHLIPSTRDTWGIHKIKYKIWKHICDSCGNVPLRSSVGMILYQSLQLLHLWDQHCTSIEVMLPAARLFWFNDWAQHGYLSGLIIVRYRSFPTRDCVSGIYFSTGQTFVGTMPHAWIFLPNPLSLFLSFHRYKSILGINTVSMVWYTILKYKHSTLHFLLSSTVKDLCI